MGSFDGAEVCELVGLFLLQKLQLLLGRGNVGLYRDDGLAALKNQSGPHSERIRKKLIELFQTYDLKITSDFKLVQADFLDVTLNLKSGKYWPYRKPNNQPLYINKRSNHPPAITKQLPSMLANRLSRLSSDENQFTKAAPDYMNAMHQSGHSTDEIRYKPNHTKKTRS